MGLARAIVVPALFERSVKNPPQRSSHDKSVPLFGPPLPTHLLRQHLHLPPSRPHQRCLSLSPPHLLPNSLCSQFFGVIGHAAPSGVAGFNCFVHKPFCFLLRRFNGTSNKLTNR